LRFWLFVKTARLRFIAILVAIGLVIVKWDTLTALYERWQHTMGLASGTSKADPEHDYWCPMHPNIVRDHPDKCPLCGMQLSVRKKGAAAGDEALPPGVVNRVQLTPYRIALAGIQTSAVAYQRLEKEIRALGFVEFNERKLARITARVAGKSRIDKLFVNVTGQHVHAGDPLALIYNPDLMVTVQNLRDAQKSGNASLLRLARQRLQLWGIAEDQIEHALRKDRNLTHLVIRSPISGHVIKKYQVEGEYVEEGARLYDIADLSTVWVEAQLYEDELAYLKVGRNVQARARAFPNRVFAGKVAFVHPHLDAATRTLRVRFDLDNARHELRPGMYATVALRAPVARLDLHARALSGEWRDRLVGEGLALARVGAFGLSGEMGLESLTRAAVRKVAGAHNLVLAVPESAVIDTGTRQLVYREVWPGAYDALPVQLGPRCGDFFPVLRGLEAGDKVVTAGSFLVDAETRLSAGVGSTYFGASGGPHSERPSATGPRPSQSTDEDAKVKIILAKLSRVDRRLAEAQLYCPVLGGKLGGMGMPVKIYLDGQPVLLCCKGCEKQARDNASRTLARVEQYSTRGKSAGKTTDDERELQEMVRENLARLSAEDRRLAKAQGYCPVQQENQLGSMGVPFKVMVKGRPVFLCCDGCQAEARAHPGQTLATVERLKGKGQGGKH
jgi:Cu(I)/Ag(I) efflux system membrane fusion protein